MTTDQNALAEASAIVAARTAFEAEAQHAVDASIAAAEEYLARQNARKEMPADGR